MNNPAKLHKLPTPKPVINLELVEHLTGLLKAAQDGELKDYVAVFSHQDKDYTYLKDLDCRYAACASTLLLKRIMEP